MRLLRRLRYLLQRDRYEGELDDELQFYLEMKRQELESQGLDPAAATLAARRTLGNLPLVRDHARDVWIAPWLQNVARDVRHGLRELRRSKRFTVFAALTLAVGIGATAAVFATCTGPGVPAGRGAAGHARGRHQPCPVDEPVRRR